MKNMQKLATKKNNQRGFTLVELLVVIGVIAVLSGLLLTNLVGIRQRAGDANKKGSLDQLKKALRLYYNDYNRYPASNDSNLIMGCGSDGDSACTAGGTFSANGTVYMQKLPPDIQYYNGAATDVDTYLVEAILGNAADSDIADSKSRCSSVTSEETASLQDKSYVVCQD